MTGQGVRLLALETSSATGSVALACGAEIAERTIAVPREQTERLLPIVDELLGEAGLRIADLDAIVFGRGPGSFTGLRIAAAMAQGLALAAGVPVAAVSSLQALAERAAREHAAQRVVTCVDARMGEVYWALYARNAAEAAHPLSHSRSQAGTADLGTADLGTADLDTADLGTPLDAPLGGRLGTPHTAPFLMRLVGEERLGAPATLAAPEFVEACERWDVSEAAKTPESAEAPEPRQRRAPEEMSAGERREREETPDARGTAEAEATARTARWYAAGDGWARYRAELAPLLARAAGVDDGLYPTARDLLPQATADLEAGRLLAPEHALPVYLRSAGAWRK